MASSTLSYRSVAQQMYRWTDADGQVHYDQFKPGENAETVVPMPISRSVIQAQQVYKWTDASGRVHYSQYKPPEDAGPAQVITVAQPPSSPPDASASGETETTPENAAARLNAFSEQLAREREAKSEKRQKQKMRDLEEENEQLKQELLSEQLRKEKQQQEEHNAAVVEYPLSYPQRPSHHRRHSGSGPPPCQPWPACRSRPESSPNAASAPPAPSFLPMTPPLARPNPVFQSAPAGAPEQAQ